MSNEYDNLDDNGQGECDGCGDRYHHTLLHTDLAGEVFCEHCRFDFGKGEWPEEAEEPDEPPYYPTLAD